MVAKGELCEIRLEDPSSGELFAVCPVQYGQRGVCVEPVTDSSRYYVLRVEDPATRRHAFLGMGFDNRTDAFDFNEALIRHEQQVARERAARAKVAGPGPGSNPAGASASGASTSASGPQYWGPGTAAANSTAAAEVEGLYRQTADLRLQEGQTIRVNVCGLKKPGGSATAAGAGGFLSGLASASAQSPTRAGAPPSVPCIGAIPPPPLQPGQPAAAALQPPMLAPPPVPLQSQTYGRKQVPPQQGGVTKPAESFAPAAPQLGESLATGATAAMQAPSTAATTSGQDNWATFD
ncbi:hypothetical protein PLESTM_000054000 [Pleodorina starrii]|nr:hypothetical protein PLESTM_000054000 [Pleodorina starrii]